MGILKNGEIIEDEDENIFSDGTNSRINSGRIKINHSRNQSVNSKKLNQIMPLTLRNIPIELELNQLEANILREDILRAI